MTQDATPPVAEARRDGRHRRALIGGGAALGLALTLIAGCGPTATTTANPAVSQPAASSTGGNGTSSTGSTKTKTDPASAATSSSTGTKGSGTASTGSSTGSSSGSSTGSSTGSGSSQAIPKTGLNPAIPIAGLGVALLGAAAVLGGVRRLRGSGRPGA